MATYSDLFTTPRFLLCDEPVKDDSNDLPFRSWIYAPFCQTLIEVLPIDYLEVDVDTDKFTKSFKYRDSNSMEEEFIFICVQDNTSQFETNRDAVLEEAWKWYTEYLKWDDAQLM